MPSISDPIISIKGLGKKTSDRLNQLGIHTYQRSTVGLQVPILANAEFGGKFILVCDEK